MIFLDETETRFIIFTGNIANKLLDMGYRIVQVRPDKKNKIKTVFIFESKPTVVEDLLSISNEDNALF